MKRIVIALGALALVLAACSTDDAGVATLDTITESVQETDTASQSSDETDQEAVLAFSQCMRDNGIEDFEDPDVDADGSIEFRLGGVVQDSEAGRDTVRDAFEACQEHLDGLALGVGSIDRSEIEDTMYEFAVCMRENGIDMPDPDFSNIVPGEGRGEEGGGPFGGALDPSDPAFQDAFEACQDVFGGGFRFGGPRRGQG